MRVVESRARREAYAAGAVTPFDDFAALRSGCAALPAIGGYRILHSRPAVRRAPARARHWQRRESARLHASGFLSVLFIGGLGLAILPGPASCLCEHRLATAAIAEPLRNTRALGRFAYTKASVIGRDHRATMPADWTNADVTRADLGLGGFALKLPKLTTADLVEARGPTNASPISTAAIAPRGELPAQGRSPARVAGFPATMEPLADAAPKPIRLAAASPVADEIAPPSPITVMTAPPAPEVEAVEVKPERTHVSTKRRTRTSHARRKRYGSAKSTGPKVAQAPPRWAMQMFDTPWQSQAFSYIR